MRSPVALSHLQLHVLVILSAMHAKMRHCAVVVQKCKIKIILISKYTYDIIYQDEFGYML